MSEGSPAVALHCVVDANVAIKLFVDEPLSKLAQQVFAALSADPPAELHVPDLFFIECTNILWKYTWRFGRPLQDSQADLIDLGKLDLNVTSTANLMEDALALAVELNISAYDACYAALARRLELPLLTADSRLARTVQWAISLSDVPAQDDTRYPQI